MSVHTALLISSKKHMWPMRQLAMPSTHYPYPYMNVCDSISLDCYHSSDAGIQHQVVATASNIIGLPRLQKQTYHRTCSNMYVPNSTFIQQFSAVHFC